MKVVIFCGGFGVRMGEETQRIPKPMIPVGNRPILWHIMKWYASWGHEDFVLCLGYKADSIKEYFLNYNEALSDDFILSNGGRDVELLGSDISSWRIAFVNTGARSTIAERLLAVRSHLEGEEYFLATYGDGLTDAPLPGMIDRLRSTGKTGLFLSVRPVFNAHVVDADADGVVRSVEDMEEADVRINGGFFVFRHNVLDYINPGEEIVEEPFRRLIVDKELIAYRHDGFWEPMDTMKDKQRLDALEEGGRAPWRNNGIPADIDVPMLREENLMVAGARSAAAPQAVACQTLATAFDPRHNSLNALRLALATLVIVSHAWPIGGFGNDPHIGDLSFGGWAVAGFFAISGFLITSSRLRSSFSAYLWRRMLRIFPGLWVACSSPCCCSSHGGPGGRRRRWPRSRLPSQLLGRERHSREQPPRHRKHARRIALPERMERFSVDALVRVWLLPRSRRADDLLAASLPWRTRRALRRVRCPERCPGRVRTEPSVQDRVGRRPRLLLLRGRVLCVYANRIAASWSLALASAAVLGVAAMTEHVQAVGYRSPTS